MRRFSRVLVFAAMAALPILGASGDAVSASSAADDVRLSFRDVGPETGYSGSGTGFTFNSDTREVILPTTKRIFRTMNGGGAWSPIDFAVRPPADRRAYLPPAQTAGSYFVRQDPNHRRVLYAVAAGDYGQLARSDDFGTTWRQLEDSNPDRIFNFSDVAILPGSSNVLLALRQTANEWDESPLWRSEDGGATFMPQLNTGLPVSVFDWETEEECDPFYQNIATTPADPDVVYVVQRGHGSLCATGIYKSLDGGRTFALVHAGNPLQVFPHPTLSGVLYMQTVDSADFIYRSENGGASFQPVAGGLPRQGYFVSFDRRNPALVLVAGAFGAYRSQDGGETFAPLGLTPDQTGRFAANIDVDPSDSSVIYVNSWNGNFKSTNSGATFHAINNGWRAARIRTIGFDNAGDPNLYLATDHGIYRTHTRGHDFERVPHPGLLDNTTALAFAPTDPRMILATVDGNECCLHRLFRTIDGGQSWIEARIGNVEHEVVGISNVTVDPHNSSNVYLVGQFECVYPEVGPPTCESNPADGLYKSIDAGASFELVYPSPTFRGFVFDPIHPNVILATCSSAFCVRPFSRSTDGGHSFDPVPGQAPLFLAQTGEILMDPYRENSMLLLGYFFLTGNSSVPEFMLRSTDGGVTFAPLGGAGLTDGWCSPTAFDPKDAGHFQCVADKLYTTRDGGETFSATPADPIAKLAALTVLTHRKQQKLLYLLGSSLLEVEIHE